MFKINACSTTEKFWNSSCTKKVKSLLVDTRNTWGLYWSFHVCIILKWIWLVLLFIYIYSFLNICLPRKATLEKIGDDLAEEYKKQQEDEENGDGENGDGEKDALDKQDEQEEGGYENGIEISAGCSIMECRMDKLLKLDLIFDFKI